MILCGYYTISLTSPPPRQSIFVRQRFSDRRERGAKWVRAFGPAAVQRAGALGKKFFQKTEIRC